MGVVKTICNALLGPLIIYLILMAHVVYQVAFQTPEPLKVPSWPSTTDAKDKEAIIAARKPLIRALMDAMSGKDSKKFAEKYMTTDAEYEDPIERVIGKDELVGFWGLGERVLRNCELTVKAEHHAPHEIIMDWTVKFQLSYLPNQDFQIPMYTHILLEPSKEKVGGEEKIFKIYEEWYGNVLLTEKTFKPSYIGKLQARLRRFTGYLITQLFT